MSDARTDFLARIEAITDPARAVIIDALLVEGRATLAELKKLVPEAKGTMRWHIKRLEETGFIRAVPDADKPTWEPAETRLLVSPEDADDAGTALALRELDRVVTDRRRRYLAEWAAARWERPWADSAWAEATMGRDYIVLSVTPDELNQLDTRLAAVVDQFRAEVEQAAAADTDPDTDREPVFLTLAGFPWLPRQRSPRRGRGRSGR